MDPTHYEKIADKLMQFRGKLPKNLHLVTQAGKNATGDIKEHIDDLLTIIEWYARHDAHGWIR